MRWNRGNKSKKLKGRWKCRKFRKEMKWKE
jgi:hypothetical protein